MFFTLCVYKYFDYALNLTIKSANKNIFDQDQTDILIKSIKVLHKNSLGKLKSFKESLRSRSYDIRKNNWTL